MIIAQGTDLCDIITICVGSLATELLNHVNLYSHWPFYMHHPPDWCTPQTPHTKYSLSDQTGQLHGNGV